MPSQPFRAVYDGKQRRSQKREDSKTPAPVARSTCV